MHPNVVRFESYVSAKVGVPSSTFLDEGGTTLVINTKTLIKMFALVKFDLIHRGLLENYLTEIETEARNCTSYPPDNWFDPTH